MLCLLAHVYLESFRLSKIDRHVVVFVFTWAIHLFLNFRRQLGCVDDRLATNLASVAVKFRKAMDMDLSYSLVVVE
jgi:hypothetical protein